MGVGLAGPAVFGLWGCGGESEGTGSTTPTGSSTSSSGGGGAGGEASTGSGGQGGAGGGGGTGGSGPNCVDLAPVPIDPTAAVTALSGSEDMAFDGKGHIAGKDGDNIVLIDSMNNKTTLAALPGNVYGLRYRANGDLVAALPNDGKVVAITPAGVVSDYATGFIGPNGVYPDADDNVWVTQLGGSKVSRINPDKTVDTIVMGADGSTANGVVYDAKRKLLFYTNYNAANVRSTTVPPSGAPATVATIAGAKLDGLVMDACGNIYVVDQPGSQIYRIKLDAAGVMIGMPELLAKFPKGVANAQFGAGPGFDVNTLYAVGLPGTVFAVPLGIPGATIPMPP